MEQSRLNSRIVLRKQTMKRDAQNMSEWEENEREENEREENERE